MALTLRYEGRTLERNERGISNIVTYSGTKADCTTHANSAAIGSTSSAYGRLVSSTANQSEGAIWIVTDRYENVNGASSTEGSEVTPPDYTYGEFSASLDCSMLSSPLEIHKNASGNFDYKCNWNHYLIAKVAVGGTTPSAPAWWSTLGADPSTGEITPIPTADQSTFQWSEYQQLPQEQGYNFIVLKPPTMAGYQSYDRVLVTQTESARYRNRADAVAAVAKYANHTGTPINNPGSPFTSGNWKCDRVTVSWTGEYWLASLTWTYSPDGWNSTLYTAVPNP